ncbi:hypothetical protein EG327_002624 [Venturia inaequalis]|uniref:Uncharacterized protein n=1 Tax=Venturia inaequalis TaxID=5025 RepID=A0A8H3ZEQ7_VENIN|nr:hypothetical protein EG327_002624 [Venturia inaequalis]
MGSSLSCFRASKPRKEEPPKPNNTNTNTNNNDNDKTAPSLMTTTPTDPIDITDHSTFTTPYYRTSTPANWPLTSPSPLQTPQTPPRNAVDATSPTTTTPTTRTPIYDNYIGGAATVGSHFETTTTTPTPPTPTTTSPRTISYTQNPGPFTSTSTATATNNKTRIPQLAPLPFTQTPPRTAHQYQSSARDTSRLPHRSHSGGGDGGIHAPPNNDPSPQSGRSYLCNSGGGDGGGGGRRRGE